MKRRRTPASPVLVPRGFLFSSLAAGIKVSGKPDLALAEAPAGATAAALFTRNRVAAAPVEVGRANLKSARGKVRALLVNSGNANCATGAQGRRDSERVCRKLAGRLEVPAASVFPSSTGIIGVPLPAEKILRALLALLEARAATPAAAHGFARAIMTTDSRAKLTSCELRVRGRRVRLLGVAKGAGMIHPQMATMLVYLFTDVRATSAELQRLLRAACDETFNCISVDGDTSTNDTVLLMASGASGVALRSGSFRKKFQAAVTGVCRSLAEQIIRDGEGVRHVVRLRIEQARDREEALRVARAIANSPLVKTAWAGADPNWGRILAAAGASGAALDPERINIFFGRRQVCRRGAACRFNARAAHRYLSQPEHELRVQLGRGRASLLFLTGDLTANYVRINADYST